MRVLCAQEASLDSRCLTLRSALFVYGISQSVSMFRDCPPEQFLKHDFETLRIDADDKAVRFTPASTSCHFVAKIRCLINAPPAALLSGRVSRSAASRTARPCMRQRGHPSRSSGVRYEIHMGSGLLSVGGGVCFSHRPCRRLPLWSATSQQL